MATSLKVLIADDEQMARKRMRRLLEEMKDIEIVAECTTGQAALDALEEFAVDVGVLDIDMPGLSGLQISQLAPDLGVEIILATAHADRAALAFDHGVVDFVLKPVEAQRLRLAIERARARLGREDIAADRREEPAKLDRLAIEVRGEVRLLKPNLIHFAELRDELVMLKVEREEVWCDLSLQDLERKLTAHGFARVHRRALLNLAHIERLKPMPTGGYIAVTTLGDEVPVSRQEARKLRQQLGLGREPQQMSSEKKA